jgi:hypothetical protein
LNLGAVCRVEKAFRMMPDEPLFRAARLSSFLFALTENLTPKELQEFIRRLEMPQTDQDLWLKLESRSKKLEMALRSRRITKPSHVYHVVAGAAPDEVLFLLYHSAVKTVQDRIKNYFQKYLPAVREIPQEAWASLEARSGIAKYAKLRMELIASHLDHRRRHRDAPVPVPVPIPLETSGVRRAPGAR